VRKADEFLFLEGGCYFGQLAFEFLNQVLELIPWTASDAVPKRKIGKPRDAKEGISAAPTLLDQFVITAKKDGDKSDNSNLVVNDDGTMYVAGDE
jgi:hypothetical protein